MGSLAYALGGAMAGAGQGLETVGKEQLDTLKQAKLEELRAAHQEQMQQELMKHQSGLQESQQRFQHGEDVYKTEQAVKAASATRAFEHEENEANRASHEKIGAGHDTAREYSAAVGALSRASSGKGGGPKPYRTITVQGNPMGKDDIEKSTRIITHDPNSDQLWVTIGDRTFRAGPNGEPVDRDGKPITDFGSLARMPPGMANDIIGDPVGKAGKSLKSDVILRKFNYLPSGYLGALQNSRAPTGMMTSASASLRLPSGMVVGGVPAGGGGGETDTAPENQENEEGGQPSFQSGANQTYGNVAGQ